MLDYLKKECDLEIAKLDSSEQLLKQKQNLIEAYQQFSCFSKHFVASDDFIEKRLTRLRHYDDSAERQGAFVASTNTAESFEHLINILPVAVIIIDEKGMIRQANEEASQLLDMEVIGVAWKDIIDQAFELGKNEYEVYLTNGKTVQVETKSLAPQPGQVVVIADISERKQLQEIASRQEKYAQMGQMMACLSHQIRTPLCSAMLYASQILDEKLDSQQQYTFQDKLISRLHHIEQLVKSMLSFVRGDPPLKQKISLDKFIENVRGLLSGYEKKVEINFILKGDAKDKYLFVNLDEVISVVANLIDNAIDAMKDEPNESHLLMVIHVQDNQIMLNISDNGCGINDEEMKTIFEPFKSSKPSGTGLGLAIVKNVIKHHHGSVEVRSKLGVGTQFKIGLPLTIDTVDETVGHPLLLGES